MSRVRSAAGAAAAAAAAFFWSRLAHALTCTCGIAFLRTVAFVIGSGAQLALFLRLVSAG